MVWYIGSEKEKNGIIQLDKSIDDSNDRSAAILAGSIVEIRLSAFLERNLQLKQGMWQRLSQPSGPIGAFATKIDLAYMAGLISSEAHADLVVIKDVRNYFAHRLDINDFSSKVIEQKCQELKVVEYYVVSSGDDIEVKSVSLEDNERPMNGRPEFVGAYFRMGHPNAKEELKHPRMRYVWSARVFTMAFGLKKYSDGQQI